MFIFSAQSETIWNVNDFQRISINQYDNSYQIRGYSHAYARDYHELVDKQKLGEIVDMDVVEEYNTIIYECFDLEEAHSFLAFIGAGLKTEQPLLDINDFLDMWSKEQADKTEQEIADDALQTVSTADAPDDGSLPEATAPPDTAAPPPSRPAVPHEVLQQGEE